MKWLSKDAEKEGGNRCFSIKNLVKIDPNLNCAIIYRDFEKLFPDDFPWISLIKFFPSN